ncbi:hypothetical protein L2E82_15694 [Cichorium intybus]|uniref:Uncharacterized protein n=1 Tax=Cichorium intybus TaxID=13427 RepID=A0ACB9F2T7_CICIN|nr:hypothetical protein L2E82_15694 [Cichorium intybus]
MRYYHHHTQFSAEFVSPSICSIIQRFEDPRILAEDGYYAHTIDSEKACLQVLYTRSSRFSKIPESVSYELESHNSKYQSLNFCRQHRKLRTSKVLVRF